MVKVHEKKLGREGADGFAYLGENRIEIDPRLPPKRRLVTEVHELYHSIFNDDSEANARKAERIAHYLWKWGYRKMPEKFR